LKLIPLGNGVHAKVDDEDYTFLSKITWRLFKARSGLQYARGWVPEKRRKMFMHNLLLPLPVGKRPDHFNGDGTDNRRSNLRPATQSQNIAAARPWGKSRYKGVSPIRGRWRARITQNYRTVTIGYYGTEHEAAAAYDKAAKSIHGHFARLNLG
jgi:hypothetical protein